MRHLVAAGLALVASATFAQFSEQPVAQPALNPSVKTLPKRLLLVPVDDRPATTQFAQMVGDLADVEVVTPPAEILGQFLTPGSPEAILQWMRNQDIASFDAVIVSSDMVAFGGLIASRTDRTSQTVAQERLRELWRIRKTSHKTPFYVFSAQMRIAPTATAENAGWREPLYYLAVARERYRLDPSKAHSQAVASYSAKVPASVLKTYDATRQRNVNVQIDLVRMVRHGAFNHLVIGQDDSFPVGPHQPELAKIASVVSGLGVNSRVQVCAGIDQIACNLVSKAILDHAGWRPRMRVVFTEPKGQEKVAPYESQTIVQSLRDQIETSGAIVADTGPHDFSLYINTPDPSPRPLQDFLENLKVEIDRGNLVAVADVNLGWSGTADPNLFEALLQDHRAPKLVSYAGWNTAGNSMGTSIPAANVYLAARQFGVDPTRRETSIRRFLLHRLVNDYFYHRYVRPEAYKLIERLQKGERSQIALENLPEVDALVRADMTRHLEKLFADHLYGRPFFVDDKKIIVRGLKDVQVKLPWPRAFEVMVDFELDVQVTDAEPESGSDQSPISK